MAIAHVGQPAAHRRLPVVLDRHTHAARRAGDRAWNLGGVRAAVRRRSARAAGARRGAAVAVRVRSPYGAARRPRTTPMADRDAAAGARFGRRMGQPSRGATRVGGGGRRSGARCRHRVVTASTDRDFARLGSRGRATRLQRALRAPAAAGRGAGRDARRPRRADDRRGARRQRRAMAMVVGRGGPRSAHLCPCIDPHARLRPDRSRRAARTHTRRASGNALHRGRLPVGTRHQCARAEPCRGRALGGAHPHRAPGSPRRVRGRVASTARAGVAHDGLGPQRGCMSAQRRPEGPKAALLLGASSAARAWRVGRAWRITRAADFARHARIRGTCSP